MLIHKKLVMMFAVLLVIGGAATGVFWWMRPDASALVLYGNIDIRQVDLSFQVGGRIASMLKDEGDTVQKGEVIAILDKRDYKAALDEAEAQLEYAQAMLDDAETKFKRKTPLCKDKIVSELECDTLTFNKNAAEAQLALARAQLENAQNKFDYTELWAPDDGVITVRAQEPGAIVAETQKVYTLSKTTPVWARVFVPEPYLGRITYGMKATILTDSLDPKTNEKKSYEGTIGYISPVSEFTPKTVQSTDLRPDLVYRVRVYVDNVDDFLRQGMPVTVKLNLQ